MDYANPTGVVSAMIVTGRTRLRLESRDLLKRDTAQIAPLSVPAE